MRKVEILPQTDFCGLEISPKKRDSQPLKDDNFYCHKADCLWKFPQKYAGNLSTQKVSCKFPQFWFNMWKFASKIQL